MGYTAGLLVVEENSTSLNETAMEEFELPVIYKGEERMLPASLQVTGYTHRFVVEVNGQSIIFEPDEERNYRAMLSNEDVNNNIPVDRELLQAVMESINSNFK